MFEGLEKRTNNRGTVTYWKDGVMVYKRCNKCEEFKPVEHFYRRGKGYTSKCKECGRQHNKTYYEANKEILKEKNKQWCEENKEYRKEYHRSYGEVNKERKKQYREANKEHIKKQCKQYYEANKEYISEQGKQRYEVNKERILKRGKQRYKTNKNNNIIRITQILHQLNPIFKQLNIKAYGNIYKVTNIKTGRCYIGQTIQPLNLRYEKDIIKGWIKDRKRKVSQKFLDELIEEDFTIETIDYGVCKYHLDKLEAYYIDKYNSIIEGYNNHEGYHRTDDGIEEFNQILKENNLEFVDGKLIVI